MINLASAKSEKDRISFFTTKNGISAIKTSDGKLNFKLENREEASDNTFVGIISIIVIFSILSFIKSFFLIPLIESNKIGAIWYLSVSFFYTCFMILGIILMRKEGGIELLRNHAAEHMIYAAYQKLKRVPSIQEAMQYSRIASNCGVTIFSGFITSQIIGFIIYVNTGIIIPEILLIFASIFFCSFFPFNLIGRFAQLFTTSKPKTKNLKLAIYSISALEIIEVYGKDELPAINSGEHKIQIR